jgi:hypothetical protein
LFCYTKRFKIFESMSKRPTAIEEEPRGLVRYPEQNASFLKLSGGRSTIQEKIRPPKGAEWHSATFGLLGFFRFVDLPPESLKKLAFVRVQDMT